MDPRTEKVILLITTRFREALVLQDLATGVELSPFHLHRLFKAQTGETPADFLNRIRLDHAAHMMVVLPDAALMQIALESGFRSAATFARAFRQHFQQSPTEFRRQRTLLVNSDAPATALSLHRLAPRSLRVERYLLDEDALTAGYRQLRARALDSRPAALGIYVDAPFHQQRSACRHYLALEAETGTDPSHSMLLPGGLYARLRVAGDIDSLSRAVLRFKTEQLDPSPFALGSTLAFERIQLPDDAASFDYRRSERDFFIKVRPRHEPAI